MEDSSLREKLGENALKKMQNYSSEIVKQEMEKNYKEVISSWFERKRGY